MKKYLRLCSPYFFIRFLLSLLLCILYLLLSTNVQFFFVALFGRNKFNYILGGFIALLLSYGVISFLARVLFLLVRGCQVATLAYAETIEERNLPVIESGITVFKQHFSSFAFLLGIMFLLKKGAKKCTTELLDILKTIQPFDYLYEKRNNPIVCHICADMLDYTFDGLLYYLIKFTKPGIEDDGDAIPVALYSVLLSLPEMLATQVKSLLLLYVTPKLVGVVATLLFLLNKGLLSGLLCVGVVLPVLLMFKYVVFDCIELTWFISAYSTHCVTKEEAGDSPVAKSVNNLLDALGISELIEVQCEGTCGTEGTTLGTDELVDTEETTGKTDSPVSLNIPDTEIQLDLSDMSEQDNLVFMPSSSPSSSNNSLLNRLQNNSKAVINGSPSLRQSLDSQIMKAPTAPTAPSVQAATESEQHLPDPSTLSNFDMSRVDNLLSGGDFDED